MNENERPNPLPPLTETVYAFLTDYYIYQDKLSWGRTQLLVAVEGGALAAAFAIPKLALFTLIIGSILVAIIWRLVERDWEVRDQNNDLLDTVHKTWNIRMIKKARSSWWRGSILLRGVFTGLLVLNVILAVLFLAANYNPGILDSFK